MIRVCFHALKGAGNSIELDNWAFKVLKKKIFENGKALKGKTCKD